MTPEFVVEILRQALMMTLWLGAPLLIIGFLAGYIAKYATKTLTAPGVLIYFIFIILSTLRLDFWLSLWTGAVAAVLHPDRARLRLPVLDGRLAGQLAGAFPP